MGFTWTTFVFEVANFLLFVWLLQRILYKPIEKAIAAREKANNDAEQHLLAVRAEGEALKAEQERSREQLDSARKRAVSEASAEAEQLRASILQRAEREIRDHERQHSERLERQQQEAEAGEAGNALDCARAATLQLLNTVDLSELDAPMTRSLVNAVRQSDEEFDAPVDLELRSARALDAELSRGLLSTLEQRLGHSVQLRTVLDPTLLAGARLRIGDELYDASLSARVHAAYQLARQRLELRQDERQS